MSRNSQLGKLEEFLNGVAKLKINIFFSSRIINFHKASSAWGFFSIIHSSDMSQNVAYQIFDIWWNCGSV